MNQKQLEMRQEILKAVCKGVTVRETAEGIAKKEYPGDTKKDMKMRKTLIARLQKDWSRRNVWMPMIVRINDSSLICELLAGMRETIPWAWMEYTKATDNPIAKINALKLVKDTNKDMIEVLQNIGAITRVEVSGNVHIDGLGLEFELDPTVKALLVEMKEQFAKERANEKDKVKVKDEEKAEDGDGEEGHEAEGD